MKKLLLAFIILAGCGTTQVDTSSIETKGVSVVIDRDFWTVYKVSVDSVDYLVARSGEGISIIKHSKNGKD